MYKYSILQHDRSSFEDKYQARSITINFVKLRILQIYNLEYDIN